MKKGFLLAIAFLVFGFGVKAQVSDILNRSQVHGSFELDAAYYMADDAIGITDSLINGRNFGFNGFGRIVYTLGKFSARDTLRLTSVENNENIVVFNA